MESKNSKGSKKDSTMIRKSIIDISSPDIKFEEKEIGAQDSLIGGSQIIEVNEG